MQPKTLILTMLASIPLLACGPMPPEQAAERCEDRARAAAGPTGSVSIGIGSGGVSSSVSIGVSSDFVAGRDPYLVYDDCVRSLTGAPPIRPLEL